MPFFMSTVSSTDLRSRYHREGRFFLIEIKLSSVRRLFNSFDPSPFLERDMDDEAERYIVDTVREFSLQTPLKLRFYLPREEVQEEADTATLHRSLRNYFEYRFHAAERELLLKLRQGRLSLLIGLTFLFGCIAARQLVAAFAGEGLFQEILEEGLLISGWVAMWRPIQIFLYDWWPINRVRQVYAKLQSMEMEFSPLEEG